MTVIYPPDVYLDHPLRFFPLAFSVQNPCYPERSLGAVLDALASVKDVADFFCLVPIHQNARFIEGGYQISSGWFGESAAGQLDKWEALVPHELPGDVWKLLPELPFRTSPRMHLRANVAVVLGAIPMVGDLRRRTLSLSNRDGRYQHRLRERYADRLRDLESGLATAAGEVRHYLQNEFQASQHKPSYVKLSGFLETVEKQCQLGELDDESLFTHHRREQIDRYIEDLLQ